MIYTVKIRKEAIIDIQEIIAWYELQKPGLGNDFKSTVKEHIDRLENIPHVYRIRYNQIRCMQIKRFPYMIHFFINEEIKNVEIYAVIHTSRSPDVWHRKTRRT